MSFITLHFLEINETCKAAGLRLASVNPNIFQLSKPFICSIEKIKRF